MPSMTVLTVGGVVVSCLTAGTGVLASLSLDDLVSQQHIVLVPFDLVKIGRLYQIGNDGSLIGGVCNFPADETFKSVVQEKAGTYQATNTLGEFVPTLASIGKNVSGWSESFEAISKVPYSFEVAATKRYVSRDQIVFEIGQFRDKVKTCDDYIKNTVMAGVCIKYVTAIYEFKDKHGHSTTAASFVDRCIRGSGDDSSIADPYQNGVPTSILARVRGYLHSIRIRDAFDQNPATT
jgi:hypothetical protein